MMDRNKVFHGDCLEVMRDIPDGSVDMIMSWFENRAKADIDQATWESMKGRISEYF